MLMITIPTVSFKRSDTPASVWPPIIQLRMRYASCVNTFRMLGTIDPKYLGENVRLKRIERQEQQSYPQENRAWTIARVPNLGPKIALQRLKMFQSIVRAVPSAIVTYRNAGMVHALHAEGY
jgi:hypothetical protein